MATKLKTFSFTGKSGGIRYPWDEWSDGSIWKVCRGKDFTTTTTNFRTGIYVKAATLGMAAHVSVPDGDTVVFQFYKK